VVRPDDCVGCLTCYHACPDFCLEVSSIDGERL
jgi:NAD-dependent dihydropyrimidine dehydrogenase PreA subunit